MYKIMQDIRLSKNFKVHEIACKDGSGELLFDYELINKLQRLRDTLGKPIIVCSAYRTPAYNKKCGGAPKSQHLLGKAADIKIAGMHPLDVAFVAQKMGFTGIGVYTHDGNYFTHVDVRQGRSYWMDATGHKLLSVKRLEDKR